MLIKKRSSLSTTRPHFLSQPILIWSNNDHMITMPNRQQLHIHNIHIPPRSSSSAGHNASIVHLLCNNKMSLVVGDINAHHSRWGTNTSEDKRGEQLADQINTASYTIHNENEATQLPTNDQSTLLGICLASNHITLLSDWSVSTSLASYHVFMLLLLSTPLHQRAASRVQHPNHVAANSLSPQVARKGSTLSGFVQRSRLEREVGRDLHSNKWEEV